MAQQDVGDDDAPVPNTSDDGWTNPFGYLYVDPPVKHSSEVKKWRIVATLVVAAWFIAVMIMTAIDVASHLT